VIQVQQVQTERYVIETLLVSDTRYIQVRGRWLKAPEAAPRIDDLVGITPDAVTGGLDRLERVGEEVVNARQTVHYRGDRDSFPIISSSDTFDPSRVESAQLDLWVDQAENFIVKMTVSATENEGGESQQFVLTFDYFDFNADIVIAAPAGAIYVGNIQLPNLRNRGGD
jgi:hypothetical protein